MAKKAKKYTFRNYIEYMKNNPKNYWFKRRLYGWGWVPVRKEGWFVVLGFLAVIFADVLYLTSKVKPSNADISIYLGVIAVSIFALIWACYKTGEKPKWTWGR